jgi:hypothetical protein
MGAVKGQGCCAHLNPDTCFGDPSLNMRPGAGALQFKRPDITAKKAVLGIHLLDGLPEKPARAEVLTFLAKSANYGNLGLFIGAGFSKAVLNENSRDKIALSWGELLEKVAKRLHVDYRSVGRPGVSYPQIASMICAKHCAETDEPFGSSLRQLKNEIARLTSWYPSSRQRTKFSGYLESFSPAWIITTNYDLVIEALLTGRSITLGPNDPLFAPVGFVPVFHLHGVRTQPKDIIIAQEDYITLFRPSEYRQIKLVLTLKESTTLFLGYALGDVNVLTALDWSKHVFKGKQGEYPKDVVQVVRTKRPRKSPYRDKNGIVIIETAELSDFFDDFGNVRTAENEIEQKKQKRLRRLAHELISADGSMVARFIDDKEYRTKILRRVSESSIYLVAEFIPFLDKCIAETWRRAQPRGCFEGYNQNLSIILDTLTAFEFKKFPPALFQTAAENLERVASLVGDQLGQSYSASRTWSERKKELSQSIVSELTSVAKQYGYQRLKQLLKTLGK